MAGLSGGGSWKDMVFIFASAITIAGLLFFLAKMHCA